MSNVKIKFHYWQVKGTRYSKYHSEGMQCYSFIVHLSIPLTVYFIETVSVALSSYSHKKMWYVRWVISICCLLALVRGKV